MAPSRHGHSGRAWQFDEYGRQTTRFPSSQWALKRRRTRYLGCARDTSKLRCAVHRRRWRPTDAEDLRRSKERNKKVGILGEWAQVPSGQQQVGREPGICNVSEKLDELVIATRAETDHRSTVVGKVGAQPAQHLDSGTRGKKCHDISGRRDDIERLGDTPGRQI